MQRKRMRVVDISEASYDDVKEVVAEDEREEPPPNPPLEPVVAVQPPTEPEEVRDEIQNGEFIEVKAKKQAPRASCEWCGREMTAKNLRYTHMAICPNRPIDSEETAPPPQPLVRAETIIEPMEPEPIKTKTRAKPKNRKGTDEKGPEIDENPPKNDEIAPENDDLMVPEPAKPKAKAKPRAKKVIVSETPIAIEPPKRRSKMLARAEHYEKLAASALP